MGVERRLFQRNLKKISCLIQLRQARVNTERCTVPQLGRYFMYRKQIPAAGKPKLPEGFDRVIHVLPRQIENKGVFDGQSHALFIDLKSLKVYSGNSI